MRCEQFRELISAYIERSIAPPLAKKMEEHAAGCTSCRAELEGVQQLWQMMAEARRVEPPASLHARILQEVHERVPAAPRVRWWELAWRPRFAFAAAAALAVLALVLWSRQTPTDAIVLSVVSGSVTPVSRVQIDALPVRFERFLTEGGSLRWVLKFHLSPQPVNARVKVGGQTLWSGTVHQQTSVVLPATPSGQVQEVSVTWGEQGTLKAWLPAEVAQEPTQPVLLLKQRSIEQTVAHLAQAYGVPLVLVGEADPLTRVDLESMGVALDRLLAELAEQLNLQVSRAEDGTIVLTAR
ncbi:MAG: zf-HC2 domain-containing protein [Armatimonadota bacterium]|nr:zf-HC2 domain-containing protein [bacterium]MCS7309751.1 zf-HC2 domain-containing protein [Armatimonadota bacterium]MDW8103834.1 zf-HC2 domain-containing protein [Armatimonadota bacterium]MDW8291047.1 zf-HC2 domain-containing protein [Armatimonadota bacterium]